MSFTHHADGTERGNHPAGDLPTVDQLPNTPEALRTLNGIDALDHALAVVPETETVARDALEARRAEYVTRAHELAAEHRAALTSGPKLLADHHGRIVGTL